MSPAELLESLAKSTWNRIHDGHRLHVSQGETAITDHLLLEIARFGSPFIQVAKTPLDVEGSQGTDWEWWIGATGLGWLRYAIQAKRVNWASGRYDQLGHTVGGEHQWEILDRYATGNRAIPMYCFYNHVERRSFAEYWHCHRPEEPAQLGCSVTPLWVVDEALKSRGCRNFNWIHQCDATLPWRCLVRCPPFLSHIKTKGWADGVPPEVEAYFRLRPKVYDAPPDQPGLQRVNGDMSNTQIARFDRDLYDPDIGVYPRRVAIFDLSASRDLMRQQMEEEV